MRVASIGECMIEFSAATDSLFARGFCGDTLNTALYLARLGVDTSYVTALGDDPLSDAMVAAWEAEGIKTDGWRSGNAEPRLRKDRALDDTDAAPRAMLLQSSSLRQRLAAVNPVSAQAASPFRLIDDCLTASVLPGSLRREQARLGRLAWEAPETKSHD
jgi:hypothetical protein